MDLKDRKLKIAEFINSVDNGLEYELIVTNMGGIANRAMYNAVGCHNSSIACKGSINDSNCRNIGANCNDSTNRRECIGIQPPPGTDDGCGTVNSTYIKP